ncbi:hypothetical protein AB1E18_002153 [Capra hircus]
MPDLCFCRDPEQTEKEKQVMAEKAVTKEELQGGCPTPAPEFTAAQPEVVDWSEGLQVSSAPIQQFLAQPATADWPAAPLLRPLNGITFGTTDDYYPRAVRTALGRWPPFRDLDTGPAADLLPASSRLCLLQ